jgi:hypothetical protein
VVQTISGDDRCAAKARWLGAEPNPSGAALSVYLMTGTLTGLSGNRILLMSRLGAVEELINGP